VRLVLHHAAEPWAFPAFASYMGAGVEEPPWAGEVLVGGERLPEERVRSLFHEPYPLPAGRELHSFTASLTARLVRALLSEQPVRVHAPAPAGRPGGYPLLVSRERIELDLPAGLDEAAAIAVNERAAHWDGIERIEADGTVVFTEATGLGRVAPDEVEEAAAELEARRAW
jgi:hypothetical protein